MGFLADDFTFAEGAACCAHSPAAEKPKTIMATRPSPRFIAEHLLAGKLRRYFSMLAGARHRSACTKVQLNRNSHKRAAIPRISGFRVSGLVLQALMRRSCTSKPT